MRTVVSMLLAATLAFAMAPASAFAQPQDGADDISATKEAAKTEQPDKAKAKKVETEKKAGSDSKAEKKAKTEKANTEDKDAKAASAKESEDSVEEEPPADPDAKDIDVEKAKADGNWSDAQEKAALEKKREADQKAKDKQKRALDKRADAIASRLAGLAYRLEAATEDLAQVNERIAKEEKTLKAAKKKLKKHKKVLSNSKENVREGAKAIYTDGGTRLMSVLLGATSFEDFASRLYLYEKITAKWQHVFAVHKKRAARVKKESKAIEKKIDDLEDLRIQAQSLGDSIAENIAEQEKALSKLDKEMSKIVNKKTDKYLRTYSSAFSKANTAAQAWYNGSDGASDTVKGSHPSIEKIAMKYLGVKYVWAGASPSGFDCSGLTMYCYNKIGIALPHSARMQYSCGTHVSKKALKPGDLVFFGQSVASIHHVGIYIGDDKFIHAPNTGDVVKVSTLSQRSDCVGATRPK